VLGIETQIVQHTADQYTAGFPSVTETEHGMLWLGKKNTLFSLFYALYTVMVVTVLVA
jgi:hypothetical protein